MVTAKRTYGSVGAAWIRLDHWETTRSQKQLLTDQRFDIGVGGSHNIWLVSRECMQEPADSLR
jgi:hypothetical protein